MILTEYIENTPIDDKKQFVSLLPLIMKTLRRLHEISFDNLLKIVSYSRLNTSEGRKEIIRGIKIPNALLSQYSWLLDVLKDFENYFINDDFQPTEIVLNHGDLHNRNILIQKTGGEEKVFFIDFARAKLAGPEYDLGLLAYRLSTKRFLSLTNNELRELIIRMANEYPFKSFSKEENKRRIEAHFICDLLVDIPWLSEGWISKDPEKKPLIERILSDNIRRIFYFWKNNFEL